MTWFHKSKARRSLAPQQCQRCRLRPATEQIHMLWRATNRASADEAPDWWLCAECAAELRNNEPPTA
jgi:hypothetical protein